MTEDGIKGRMGRIKGKKEGQDFNKGQSNEEEGHPRENRNWKLKSIGALAPSGGRMDLLHQCTQKFKIEEILCHKILPVRTQWFFF